MDSVLLAVMFIVAIVALVIMLLTMMKYEYESYPKNKYDSRYRGIYEHILREKKFSEVPIIHKKSKKKFYTLAYSPGVILNKKFTQNVWLLKDDTDIFLIITDDDFHNNYEVMGCK